MANPEGIKKAIKEIFSEDMLLCFWTHEKCPPSQQEEKGCQFDSAIKHDACMPCWDAWVDGLVEQVMQKLHSQDVVIIDTERELPDNEAWHKNEREFEAYCAGRNELVMAGYVAMIPLQDSK